MPHQINSHSIWSTGDTRYSGPATNSITKIVKMTAIMIGIYLKRYQFPLDAKLSYQLTDMLGGAVDSVINQYLLQFKTHEEGLTTQAAIFRETLYAMWDTNIENLLKLKLVIEQNPFCSIFPDQYCKAPDHLTVTVHTKTVHEVKTQLNQTEYAQLNIEEIETTYAGLDLIAVSQLSWSNLNLLITRPHAHRSLEDDDCDVCSLGCSIS